MYWMAFSLIAALFSPSAPTYKQHKPYKFAVIGDTQINRHIFLRAVADIKKRKPKFVVHVGDLYWCSSKKNWKWYKKHIDSTKIPWHMVIGNHELLHCAVFGVSTRYKWRKFWRRKIYRKSTMKVFDYRGHKFVLMDSSTSSIPYFHLRRIKRILKTSSKQSVFLFSHKPLPYRKKLKIYFGKKKLRWHHHWAMAGLGWFGRNKSYWYTLAKYKDKIKAFFHGHYHAFRSYKLDGIPAYCTGGGGGKLETKIDYHHYLMVHVRHNNHAVKVHRL